MRLRPGTSDHAIWQNVVDNNEYKLPDSMRDWVVIDIGAHIGAFSCACVERDARKIYAFEPDRENFGVLQENTGLYSRVVPMNFAVIGTTLMEHAWLSDYPRIGDEINTGGASLYGTTGKKVNCMSFDRVIRGALNTEDRDKIDLVKLDCEGAEWFILFNSEHIQRSWRYVGEFHEYGKGAEWPGIKGYKITDMEALFKMNGYKFEFFRHSGHENLGMFFAERI